MTFQEWLDARFIDVQSLTPELKTALVAQWVNETLPIEPPQSLVVIADDECWPFAERVPVF